MLRCMILVGHPIKDSFNAALAERYAQVLRAGGADARLRHLAELEVPPTLLTRSPGDAEMVGDVARLWDDMVWADHFVLVHPLWWGGMPAKLKALFDVMLQPGKAYRYEGDKPLPIGFLGGRTARLIVTSDTPGWFMTLVYRNAHFRQVKNQILKFVGYAKMGLTHCSVMRNSTPDQRARMLDKVASAARKDLALAPAQLGKSPPLP